MPRAFVDTHVHFWDHALPDITWDWLRPDIDPGVPLPVVGLVDAIKGPRYTPAEFLAEVAGLPVEKVVHVQAAVDTPDPVLETAWLDRLADTWGLPQAIVAHAELAAPDVEQQLDRHIAASARLRGIRDFGVDGYLQDPAFARGYAALGPRELVAELSCRWAEMASARDLAVRHPDVVAVLDHAGYPTERTPEYLEAWRRGIDTLAQADNVHCKISGLGMGDHTWTVESLRPWVEHCLERFGVERCMFGTNWPVDRLFSPYAAVVEAYEQLVSDYSTDEQDALLAGNAERLFRI